MPGRPQKKTGPARRKRLPPLTPAGREILAQVLNSLALANYERLRTIEGLAASLRRSSGRLKPMIRRLDEQGYLSADSNGILPTIEAIRSQDPSLSEKDAAKLIAGAKKRLRVK
jgi:hypothetical protein